MSAITIAILEPGYRDYAAEGEVLSAHDARIVPVSADEDAASSLKQLDPVALLVRERPVTASEIDSCPNLKVIVRYGVGVDNIDLAAASARRIHVANVPDYGAENEVSEHALALYLAVQRRIPSRDREVREGRWGVGQEAPVPNRENAVLGLIGCGKIGLEVARKFRAIGFASVLGYDPYLDADTAKTHGIQIADLDTLCSEADVVSLHTPYTAETRHILDREKLGRMKPQSILINVSRGGLVDETALADCLAKNRIFGAGIDVFEHEPLDPEHPLLGTPNTVLSDHTAWYSERTVSVLQRNAAHEVERVLRGEKPRNWVNPW
jgi:D-3-phosphoglycerate dehydrogenase